MRAAFATIKTILASPSLKIDETLSTEWADLCYRSFNAERVPKEWLRFHLWVDEKDLGPFKDMDDEALFQLMERDRSACVIPGSRVKITDDGKPVEWCFPRLDREVEVDSLDSIVILAEKERFVCESKTDAPRGVILIDSGTFSAGGLSCDRDNRRFEALHHVCSMSSGEYTLEKPTLGPQVSLHFTLKYGDKAAHKLQGVVYPASTDFTPIERTDKAAKDIVDQLNAYRHKQFEHVCILVKNPMCGYLSTNSLDGFTRAVYKAAASSGYYRTNLYHAVLVDDAICVIDSDENPVELKRAVCVSTGDYAYTPIGTVVLDGEEFVLRQVAVLVVKIIHKRPFED